MGAFDNAWVLAAALLLPGPGAASAPSAHADTDDARCKALSRADFSATRDAPFVVTDASVASEGTAAPYCQVKGYVRPEITFEIRLPIRNWNSGFLLIGSGGWASTKFVFQCRTALARGYACIAGDGGHQNGKGLWMQADAQAKIDWGYRATHVTTLAGKALVQAYYGAPAKLSLMLGCSTGGYQGLVEAQRFPWDFDGIVAIAPDIDQGDLHMRTAWAARHFVGSDGKPLFSTDDLAVLHRAALDACDMGDKVRDGIVGDPVACRFDPRTAQCKDDGAADCLSPEQVRAAIRIYSGPTDSAGQRLSTAGPFPGSERMWPNFLDDVTFSDGLFRFALAESPNDGVRAAAFDFDEDHKRLGLLGTFVSSNPDLRRFRQAGGKLMIVQGGNDVTEQARAAIDYYETVERVIGGRAETQAFARLFVVPGMNHCSGGDGAFAIDYLDAMERWAAHGTAPDVLIGSHIAEGAAGAAEATRNMTTPAPGTPVTFTRPIYPFPLHAEYSGTGDAADAGSFRPAGDRTRGRASR